MGADEWIGIVDLVGREPEPTDVFCGAELPFSCTTPFGTG